MHFDHLGWCRRIDLTLRAKYPYLETHIFRVDSNSFHIWINNFDGNFDDLQKEFDISIRIATTPVRLVDKKPTCFLEEIEGINDDNIPAKFEGIPFTIPQLYELIECKYPKVKVSSIKEEHDKQSIYVKIKGKISEEEKSRISETLKNIKIPYKTYVEDGGDSGGVKLPDNPDDMVFYIPPSSSQSSLNARYLERDESLWFDNIEGIYDGNFNKDNLYFYDEQKTSCYVNFSVFSNVNIRNHLLLYDTILCTMPLKDKMSFFLTNQKLSRKDLLYLVDKGRLKVINTQPEQRLDHDLLNEVYNIDNSAIISRRAISALCAIDLVSINKSYILNDLDIQKIIFKLSDLTSVSEYIPFEMIRKFLFWPLSALRKSFTLLNASGTKRISNYGVNENLEDYFRKSDKEKKLEFEFTVNSESIHIAHALNATYFPFFSDDNKYTDHPCALVMGNMLNFYKNMSFETAKECFKNLTIEEKNPSLELINIFEINDYISIEDFERNVSNSVTRKGVNSLFGELVYMGNQAREERIYSYNESVNKIIDKRYKKLLLDLGVDLAGINIPFIGTLINILNLLTKWTKNESPLMKEWLEVLDDKLVLHQQGSKKRNIQLLSRINRVVSLKKSYD